MILPPTSALYASEEGKVVLVHPLVPKSLYVIREGDLEGKSPQFQEVFKKIAKGCFDGDIFQNTRGRYYASVALSKQDWEWILTLSAMQRDKTKRA